MVTKYYHISSATKTPVYLDPVWDRDYRRQYPCLHPPNDAVMDIRVEGTLPNIPLNVCSVAGVAVARDDFVSCLGGLPNPNFDVGKVQDSFGNTIMGFYTVGSPTSFQIRGGPKSTRKFCRECGTFLYYPMGNWYFLESDLTGQGVYYGSGLMSGFIVTEEISQEIRKKNLKKLYIRDIPILKEPKDGLPHDLSTVRNEGQMGE